MTVSPTVGTSYTRTLYFMLYVSHRDFETHNRNQLAAILTMSFLDKHADDAST